MAVTATSSKAERGTRRVVKRKVVLAGLTPIMFDRYAGDNQTQLSPWQKVYLLPDGESLCLPALNIGSFLSAENTKSAPKVLMDPRKYKGVATACRNYVAISPHAIPFTRDGQTIKLGQPEGDADERSGMYIDRAVARLKDGIPNPKVRPVLPTPWELAFELTILPNPDLQEQQVHWLLEQGGLAIGFGTFRGSYGKFEVKTWE